MWESILWFLIFGGLFYLMMRMGGCGMHAHGGHGGHKSHESHAESGGTKSAGSSMVKDPVCGMNTKANEAAASMEYQGETYYFCSQKCHDTFMQDPARYSRVNNRTKGGHYE